MTWFKADDSFWRHPKVRKLGRDKLSAVGLWQLAGTWCADNVETNVADGFVPDEQVEVWDARHRYAQRLVAVGLWERSECDGEHGYMFHDWSEYQPTRATIEAERDSWRRRQDRARRRSRESQKESRRDSRAESRESHTVSHDAPVPVPVPVPSSGYVGEGESPRQRARRDPPPSTCPEHRDSVNPPACRECKRHREQFEAWETKQRQYRESLRDEIEQAKRNRNLECEHGTEGGSHIRSDNGEYLCPFCRRGHTPETNTDSQNDGNGE